MNSQKVPGWLKGLDYFFVLRPMLFFPGWSTMLAGYFSVLTFQSLRFGVLPGKELWVVIPALFLSFAALMGSTFILNQLRDVDSDRENHKLFLISDGFISPGAAVTEAVILAVLAFITGFLISLQILILYLIFFVLTGLCYNFYPCRMKDSPWKSLIANALMGWLAFAIGWAASHPWDWQVVLIDALPYLLINTALYLFTTLPDVEGDRVSNKNTFAVTAGVGPVITAAFVLFSIGALATIINSDLLAGFIYLASMPFFLAAVTRRAVPEAVRATKFTILFFAVAVCSQMAVYFLLMLGGFFATRFYFRHRFNFDYPNFSGS
jgi:4-hydroxybenzoate polyprenyltransferase